MIVQQKAGEQGKGTYFTGYASRKNRKNYDYSHEDILKWFIFHRLFFRPITVKSEIFFLPLSSIF
jgi:hypothetical protein